MFQKSPITISNIVVAEFAPHFEIPFLNETFSIPTCQRTVVIGTHAPDSIPLLSMSQRMFEGVQAYEYLLRFACGLESEIKGETDVFGQVKTAFKTLQSTQPELAEAWSGIFTKLFEDTKEIRALYLHGIGGNTYGALSRRLMNPSSQERILMIGAGEISKSVSPYFAEFPLTIWNRSEDRLHQLLQELSKKGLHSSHSTNAIDLPTLISNATLIIIATPFQSEVDALVGCHRSSDSKILHLGAQATQTRLLNFECFSLTDLFDMEKEQDQLRQKQVRNALNACHERSLLRNLSKSIHVSHGWEDLAVFI